MQMTGPVFVSACPAAVYGRFSAKYRALTFETQKPANAGNPHGFSRPNGRNSPELSRSHFNTTPELTTRLLSEGGAVANNYCDWLNAPFRSNSHVLLLQLHAKTLAFWVNVLGQIRRQTEKKFRAICHCAFSSGDSS